MTKTDQTMACPIDGTTLVMSERSGIEIDYCPTCRGVWLDRGELDKIIERNTQSMDPAPSPRSAAPSPGYDDRRDYSSHGYPRRKRKKSFLEELFD